MHRMKIERRNALYHTLRFFNEYRSVLCAFFLHHLQFSIYLYERVKGVIMRLLNVNKCFLNLRMLFLKLRMYFLNLHILFLNLRMVFLNLRMYFLNVYVCFLLVYICFICVKERCIESS